MCVFVLGVCGLFLFLSLPLSLFSSSLPFSLPRHEKQRASRLLRPGVYDFVLEFPVSNQRPIPPRHIGPRNDGVDLGTPAAPAAERRQPAGVAAKVPRRQQVCRGDVDPFELAPPGPLPGRSQRGRGDRDRL